MVGLLINLKFLSGSDTPGFLHNHINESSLVNGDLRSGGPFRTMFCLDGSSHPLAFPPNFPFEVGSSEVSSPRVAERDGKIRGRDVSSRQENAA
jgi:hypothetical protein